MKLQKPWREFDIGPLLGGGYPKKGDTILYYGTQCHSYSAETGGCVERTHPDTVRM